jgi:integrase/recombinase XerD
MSTDVLERWVSGLRARSPHTARAYRRAVKSFLAAVGKPIEEITVAEAEDYVNTLTASGLSRATVAHQVSAIRSFIRYCQGQGLIPQSPLDALKRPSVSITSANRYLTQEEAERLLKGASRVGPSAHLAVAILLLTGLRVSELAGAQWRDIFRDLDGNTGLVVRHGKGGRERVVAIRPDLWALIRADRLRRGLSPERDARDTGSLLAKRSGSRYSSVGIWKLVKAAATRAGLDKPVSPHWLRHTFGTLAAHAGATVYQIQSDLGHAHMETSQRYIHVARGLSDSAAHLIGIRLEGE